MMNKTLRQVRFFNGSYYINIPIEEVRYKNIKEGDYVFVTIDTEEGDKEDA